MHYALRSQIDGQRRGFIPVDVSSCWEDGLRGDPISVSAVDEVERLLRRLALNDEDSVEMVLGHGLDAPGGFVLRPKVELLVRLGALLALGAATASLRATVDRAIQAGATEAEIVGVLVSIAPAMGLAQVVATAPRLALAIGYDIDADE